MFIDKLNRLSLGEPQPIGFRVKQQTSPKPKIQLVASLAQESTESLTDHVDGADAGIIRIAKVSTGAEALQKISQALPDIPWGGCLQGSALGGIKQIIKAGCDFIVFSAANTPLAIIDNDEVSKILEVGELLSEGLLRATNELPVDAVLITSEQKKSQALTWQHLMLYQRFADLLTKPLLASIPAKVEAGELEALWEAGVTGVVIDVGVEQPQDRLKKLRQVIDKLDFPSLRRHPRAEPLLPRVSGETGISTAEEEEEQEE